MIKFVLFKIHIFVLLEHFIQFVYFDILKKIIKTYFLNGVTCDSSFTVWNLLEPREALCGVWSFYIKLVLELLSMPIPSVSISSMLFFV